MAFPASAVTKAEAWDDIRHAANRIKGVTQNLRNASAAGATGRTSYVSLQKRLDDTVERWNVLAATPQLQAYARDQIEDPTLDLAAEYVAMRDAATALRDWIFANIPTDAATGAVLLRVIDATGESVELTFTSAQASGFRTQADAFLATIG